MAQAHWQTLGLTLLRIPKPSFAGRMPLRVTDCQLQESLPRAGKPSELDVLAFAQLVCGQYQQ